MRVNSFLNLFGPLLNGKAGGKFKGVQSKQPAQKGCLHTGPVVVNTDIAFNEIFVDNIFINQKWLVDGDILEP